MYIVKQLNLFIMKTTKMILTTIACATSMIVNAQEMQNQLSVKLDNVSTIVLENLDGNTTFVKSDSDVISIKSELFINGDNWGWTIPESRPDFKIETRLSNDTLYVCTPISFRFKIIGVSSYKEQISSIVHIPENKNIEIVKADKLILETNFMNVKIKDAKEIECKKLNKAEMGSLLCQARSKFFVNGIERERSFEFQGAGSEHYYLHANKISLNIKE